MTKEDIINMVHKYMSDLSNVRPGFAPLYHYLSEETDYFTAPASTKYHSSYEGGLAVHSYFVLKAFHTLFPKYGMENHDKVLMICLLHDLCKTNVYKEYYRNIKEYDKSKWPSDLGRGSIKKDKLGEFIWAQEKGYMFEDNFPYGHGEKSVLLAQRYIYLEQDEIFAIRYHMGPWQDGDKNNVSKVFEKYPLAFMLHMADGYATYILEPAFEVSLNGRN